MYLKNQLCYSLKEFLPQSYAKVKGIEKKIFAEHKKHVGLSELDAKVLYTKTARALKTYGVTFFLVKVSPISFIFSLCFQFLNYY